MIAVLITLPQYNMIVAATFVDSKFQRHIFNVEGSSNVSQLKSLLESKGLVPPGFSSKLSYQKKLLSDQDSLHSIGYISENYVSFVCIRSTVPLTPAAPSHVSSITADIKESSSVPALVAPHTSEKGEGSASDATTAAPPASAPAGRSGIHSMGFDPAVVERALLLTRGDEQQAAIAILEGAVPDELEEEDRRPLHAGNVGQVPPKVQDLLKKAVLGQARRENVYGSCGAQTEDYAFQMAFQQALQEVCAFVCFVVLHKVFEFPRMLPCGKCACL